MKDIEMHNKELRSMRKEDIIYDLLLALNHSGNPKNGFYDERVDMAIKQFEQLMENELWFTYDQKEKHVNDAIEDVMDMLKDEGFSCTTYENVIQVNMPHDYYNKLRSRIIDIVRKYHVDYNVSKGSKDNISLCLYHS